MKLIYNLGIFTYNLLIHIVSPFNSKARLFISGRKGWGKDLAKKIGSGDRCIWFHCASLGEFEQGRPVLEEVKKSFPEYKIVLTFYSPSGFEVRKNYPGAEVICYLPLDTPRNARAFFDLVRPEKIFFIKYEYWVNFMSEAKKREVPFYVVSCIFRSEQIFFKNNFVGSWLRNSLKSVSHFFVQDSESVNLLAQIGLTNASISGDTRFDRVASIAENASKIPAIGLFKGNNPLLVIGSSWQPDEDMLIKFINQSEGGKFIIAPHEVSVSNLKRVKEGLAKPSAFYSKIEESGISQIDVIIIDSIGLLSSLYQYGDAAYIGGGFGVGIHNILEAATFGLPVIFGPNYKKFKEAVDMVALGLAFPISDYYELEQNLTKLMPDFEKLSGMSDSIKKYIKNNQGATQIIIKKAFEK